MRLEQTDGNTKFLTFVAELIQYYGQVPGFEINSQQQQTSLSVDELIRLSKLKISWIAFWKSSPNIQRYFKSNKLQDYFQQTYLKTLVPPMSTQLQDKIKARARQIISASPKKVDVEAIQQQIILEMGLDKTQGFLPSRVNQLIR